MKRILAIETSCDETAAAVITDHHDPAQRILSNTIYSQIKTHQEYGGVVPEIAARAHLDCIHGIVAGALDEADVKAQDVDAIAVTAGPGLIGGVIVGVNYAMGLSIGLNKPCYAVNHLEGHALTPRLSHDVAYPYLLLLTSGGHCQILYVEGFQKYRLLGTTMDDAAGEAFDKSAKLIGLDYPGGPMIEKLALKGDPKAFQFPRPLLNRQGCYMSFSGLKTAVRNQVMNELQQLGLTYDPKTVNAHLSNEFKQNLAASLQCAIADVFVNKLKMALKQLEDKNFSSIVVAGGVAANQYLNAALRAFSDQHQKTFVNPPMKLCTDNAAMIGWVGLEMMQNGIQPQNEIRPTPRWPLA